MAPNTLLSRRFICSPEIDTPRSKSCLTDGITSKVPKTSKAWKSVKLSFRLSSALSGFDIVASINRFGKPDSIHPPISHLDISLPYSILLEKIPVDTPMWFSFGFTTSSADIAEINNNTQNVKIVFFFISLI